MFANTLKQHFPVMGADVEVTVRGDRFEIDVGNTDRSEVFQIRLPGDGSVTAKVLDSDWRRRHLVLDVSHRQFGLNQKYLCGHDEFHWFVAALPEKSKAVSVSEAMEDLKPQAVLAEQRRKRVKRHRRGNRRTTAYVRQGEWFFLPCPEFDADRHVVTHNGFLVRGQGKPHHVEMLCRAQDGDTYVRGKVWHPDHRTIYLDGWHNVLRNTEIVPKDRVAERAAQLREEAERVAAKLREELFRMSFVD